MRCTPLIFLCLLALSAAGHAQVPLRSTELTFNAGTAVGKRMAAVTNQFEYRLPVRGSGGFLLNRDNVQFGLLVEIGSSTAVHWYMSPTLIGNFRVIGRQGYGYAGATVGYFYSEDGGYDFNLAFRVATGYQSGVQLGYVREIGAGFAVNADLALRAIRTMRKTQIKVPTNSTTPPYYTLEPGEKIASDVFLVPVTIGIRYRFGGNGS